MPGLIVEISDSRQDYAFRLAYFQKIAAGSKAMLPPYSGFTIPATVQEIYAGQMKELYQIANNQTGYNISVSPQQQQKLLDKIKNRNNRMERK